MSSMISSKRFGAPPPAEVSSSVAPSTHNKRGIRVRAADLWSHPTVKVCQLRIPGDGPQFYRSGGVLSALWVLRRPVASSAHYKGLP